MIFDFILSRFSKGIGIDLGTATTLVYKEDEGIILQEPSVIAVHKTTNQILAVGEEAKNMIGKTPGDVLAIRPLKSGVIADFEITEKMLKYFMNRVFPRNTLFKRPKAIIGTPCGVTEVEKKAVLEAAFDSGAIEAYLIEEPIAAAIGANLPISEPVGSMIVDIGGGTTEVAVISLGGIVVSNSKRIAGDEIDEAIIQHIRKNYNLLIGQPTAERIKIEIGSAYPQEQEVTKQIRGRDLISGLPKTITITSSEIREAIAEQITIIVDLVRSTLEQVPPELTSDIVERGITLCGGGALLRDLDKLISHSTGIETRVANDPICAVAYGTGKALTEIGTLSRILIGGRRR